MDLDIDSCYRAFCTRDPRFDGRLFAGVKTTGVYCRPICPARTPKRENMLFFPTAAAAQEAGFRPCLRCRPETVPELAAWRGTSNTVSRALSLIEHGALDARRRTNESRRAGVGDRADRLGVGERQLRRLFRKHLGASPIAVWQTRRVLLALQLIRETKLSIADVALASGFGSIRRFNEVFQGLYRRSPTSLRRTSGTPSGGPQGEVSILLRYRPPYNWPAILEFLKDRAIPGVESVSDGRYARTIEIEGTQGVVIVEAAAGHALKAAIRFPRLSALPAVIARIRHLFDLAADPHAIDAHLAEDSVLAPLVAARPGLRVPGAWDSFELVVRAVLGQQITVRAAAGLAAKLVAGYGEQLRNPSLAVDGLSHVFPRPERVALADPTTLAMPKKRALALTSLASAVARDPGILCSSQEPAACVKRLRAFAGVGDWTAEYIAMRELREPDAFPADDIGLQRAIARRDGRRPTSLGSSASLNAGVRGARMRHSISGRLWPEVDMDTMGPLRFGAFELDVHSRELRNGSTIVRLQAQPFEILRLMLEHPGRVVTRDELRRRLWGDGTYVDFEHSLNAAIRRLRTALGDQADRPAFVETVPRLGYRFIAPAQNPGGEPHTTRENALPVPRLIVDVCITARLVYAIGEASNPPAGDVE